ncbi:hypothetical protein CVT26_006357 [Gymnopilus dilepis]|uniref:MARVEL domain-containing protein n=1 Tax=Gymnopilus dilepis TaxID=231916 RepID=A0A409W675_9AGAR|nr:hypothetical protein CVT26_006357 [Gymnopilus dilepis]
MDSFVRVGYPLTFTLVILFSIIEMCISAWLIAKYNAHHNFRNSGERARVRYLLFTSLWTIVMGTLYLIVFSLAASSILSSIASHTFFLFITWALWLAAAAAITQTVGGSLNCSTQTVFVYCGQLNALIGFAWLILCVSLHVSLIPMKLILLHFSVFLSFLLFFVILRGITSAKSGEGYGGPVVESA